MKAKDLLPGQLFTVQPPDPESPVRVCLTNDLTSGLRFGWPGNERYWCYMGGEVDVTLTERCGTCPNCVDLERVRRRVLACCNPPFSHADDGVVSVWNTELARLPCTGGKG